MYKIVSFGDSFTFGSELENNHNGEKAWPGLIAKKLNVDYQTLSVPGCGNEGIARQVYTYFSSNSSENTIAIVNWTWICRWDVYFNRPIKTTLDKLPLREFINETEYKVIAGTDWPTFDDFVSGKEIKSQQIKKEILNFLSAYEINLSGSWITLGPTCVPEKLNFLKNTEAQKVIELYQNFLNDSMLWNKFKSLQTVYSVQTYLKNKNIKSIQTYMDYDMFSNQYAELSPPYIIELQELVKDELNLFNQDKNFLDWARQLNYKITPSPGDHPLEEAHLHAAEIYIEKIKALMV